MANLIKFKAFDPHIKQLRADKGWRVELEVDQSQYDVIKELPNLQDRILNVTIKEEN